MAIDSTDITKILNGVQQMIDHAASELRDDLTEKISHLPTKDEFYEETERIYSRLSTVEDEDAIKAEHISRHDNRLTDLEKIHPAGKHA